MTISITYPDGRQESVGDDRGLFGSLLHARRERKQREAHAAREARLVKLNRDIKALEQWHHEWRLTWDEDYRALHPGEWCEYHKGLTTGCRGRCFDARHFQRMREDDVEIVTWSGHVLRSAGRRTLAP